MPLKPDIPEIPDKPEIPERPEIPDAATNSQYVAFVGKLFKLLFVIDI